jgi:hypothetical protein
LYNRQSGEPEDNEEQQYKEEDMNKYLDGGNELIQIDN